MKRLLLVFVVAGLLALSGCMLFQPSDDQLARNLLNRVLEVIESGEASTPADLVQLIRQFVYIPDEDASDTDVIDEAGFLAEFCVGFNFIWPSTLTSVELKGLSEINSRYFSYNWTNKPDFVQKTYMVVAQGETEDSTPTSFSLPFLVINNEGYFFAVYLKTTGSATEVRVYPKPLILSLP